MSFQNLLYTVLPPKLINGVFKFPHITFNENGGISTDNDFYRVDGPVLHGGVDINYEGAATYNPLGQLQVMAPVAGQVVHADPSGTNVGAVVIKRDTDGTLHRVLHLDSTNVQETNWVAGGATVLGTEGGRDVGGPTVWAVHAHYDVYLPDGSGGDVLSHWDYTDIRIDPVTYWDEDLKTSFNDSGSTAVNFDEGKDALVTLSINTPHTGPTLWLKLTLTDSRQRINARMFGTDNPKPAGDFTVLERTEEGNTVWYIGLPATQNKASYDAGQSHIVKIRISSPDDLDDQNENGKLHVEAGYATNGQTPGAGNWTAYSKRLFASADCNIHVKDNDREKPNPSDQGERKRDPLILDLNADGIQTTGLRIQFDQDANGFAELTAWVEADDGFLALDRNGNGTIDNGSELFGVGTTLPNGQKASNGFDALTQYDTNADGKIDASDAVFTDLRVWQDTNQDGVTDPDELHTLGEYNITAINLASRISKLPDNCGYQAAVRKGRRSYRNAPLSGRWYRKLSLRQLAA